MAGWYKFRIKGAGGGGCAGGYHSTYGVGGVGGSEGGTTIAFEYLKKGEIVPITIGKGGQGGVGFYGLGKAGEDSFILCKGEKYIGGGGQAAWHAIEGPGLGGEGTIPGASGITSHTDTNNGHLGCHGAGSGGGIVTGYSSNIDGKLGGGGAGGYGSYNGAYSAGGKGGDGVCWIEYFDPKKK